MSEKVELRRQQVINIIYENPRLYGFVTDIFGSPLDGDEVVSYVGELSESELDVIVEQYVKHDVSGGYNTPAGYSDDGFRF